MVNNQMTDLSQVFGALSDPTRRAILERLTLGEFTVSDLAAPFSSSMPAISKHLNVLESAGLIERQTIGRQRLCTLAPLALNEAAAWIQNHTRFWNEQLDSLGDYLQSEKETQL